MHKALSNTRFQMRGIEIQEENWVDVLGEFRRKRKRSVPFWDKQDWGSIRSEGYCERILPLIDGMVKMRPWLLVMQGNAPSHAAIDTIAEFKKRYITPIQWPACSPDLNPIESVWNIMKYYIQQNYPDLDDGKQRSEDELRLIVKDAWDSVTVEQLMGLIRTMPARCKAVIDADGGYTQY